MKKQNKHQVLNFFIATVWLINGFICKVLNFVPRHQTIVARILGEDHARTITYIIGGSETLMAGWILIGIWSQVNVITQILIIAIMNTLELFLAPDLLLWGKTNAFFAFLFILVICYNEFYLNRKLTLQT